MCKRILPYLMALLATFSASGLKAQSLEEILRSADTTDQLYMPEFQVVLDSAYIHSPLLKVQQSLIDQKKAELDIQRTRWLRSLSIVSGVYYGNMNSFSSGTSSDGAFDDQFRTTTDARYNLGLSLRMPIEEFLGRPKQVKIQKMAIAEGRYRKEQISLELEQKISYLYHDMQLALRRLKIYSSVYQTAMLHLQLAEKNYYEGEIQVGELSTITRQSSQAVLDLERCKKEIQDLMSDFKALVGIEIQSFYPAEKR
jgi:outer membrane protein TolC